LNRAFHASVITCALALLSACAAVPLSQELTGKKLPAAIGASGTDVADILFSTDKKYETKDGVPLNGDPLVCIGGSVSRVNANSSSVNRIVVKAGEEVAVTSVVAWVSTGFRKVCGPFVAFTPEKGIKYVVVNERIGGKGVSRLWSAPARQTCEVSVYREAESGFTKVETRKADASQCRAREV